MNQKYVIPGILFAVFLALYVTTMVPTVYWADSGEFITAAYTLGVTHPTGYPTYTLLGHIFTYLPYGSIAWRVNFMSTFFAALSVVVMYLICLKLRKSKLAAVVLATFFGLSYTLWEQATIAEVHTLSAFLVSLNILLLLKWREEYDLKWLYLFSLFCGLMLTNHLTTILLTPAFLYLVFVVDHKSLMMFKIRKIKLKVLGKALFFGIIGLTPYLYLPIRSAMHPIWNWSGINSISSWFNHIIGAEYTLQGDFITSAKSGLQLEFFSTSFIKTKLSFVNWLYFGIPLVGLWFARKKNYLFFVFCLVLVVPVSLFSINYFTDSGAFFLPIVIIGVALSSFIKIKKKYYLLFLALLIPMLLVNYSQADLSQDYSAEYFWRNMFEAVEPGSIIFTKGTTDIFIPLYFHQVLGEYNDISLVDAYIFPREWGYEYMKNYERIDLGSYSPKSDTELLNEVLQKYDVNIYSTFNSIETDRSLSFYNSHLFKFDGDLVDYVPSYEYPTRIRDIDGRAFIARVLVFQGVLEEVAGRSSNKYFEQAYNLESSSFYKNLAVGYWLTGQDEKAAKYNSVSGT